MMSCLPASPPSILYTKLASQKLHELATTGRQRCHTIMLVVGVVPGGLDNGHGEMVASEYIPYLNRTTPGGPDIPEVVGLHTGTALRHTHQHVRHNGILLALNCEAFKI